MKLVAYLNLFWVLVGYYLLHYVENYIEKYYFWTDPDWEACILIFPFLLFFLLHPKIRKLLNDQELATFFFGRLERIEGDAVYNYTEEERKETYELGGSTWKEGNPKDLADRGGCYIWMISFVGFIIWGFVSYKILETGLKSANNEDLFYVGSCILSLINFLGIQFAWLGKPE